MTPYPTSDPAFIRSQSVRLRDAAVAAKQCPTTHGPEAASESRKRAKRLPRGLTRSYFGVRRYGVGVRKDHWRGRFHIGGTILPRFTAMTSMTIPVVVHRIKASKEDSTPKLPPVR